ncbi:unnamed protein product [Calypogeia fissa]
MLSPGQDMGRSWALCMHDCAPAHACVVSQADRRSVSHVITGPGRMLCSSADVLLAAPCLASGSGGGGGRPAGRGQQGPATEFERGVKREVKRVCKRRKPH